jgi:hypothetical protein
MRCGYEKHRSPKETIIAQCLRCTGNRKQEVVSCDGNDPAYHQCAFHPYRTGDKRASVKVMRQFCLQCMSGSKEFVMECTTTDCLIHPYRFGKNPTRAGIGASKDQMTSVSQKRRTVSRKKAA